MKKNLKTSDDKVMELFKKLKAKQKEINSAEKPKWETNCSFGFDPNSINDRSNIQVVTQLSKLIDFYAFIVLKADYWDKAGIMLNLSSDVPFIWMGYSRDQWLSDIKTRIIQLEISKQKKELETMEIKLNSLISDDYRRELELAELEKQLS